MRNDPGCDRVHAFWYRLGGSRATTNGVRGRECHGWKEFVSQQGGPRVGVVCCLGRRTHLFLSLYHPTSIGVTALVLPVSVRVWRYSSSYLLPCTTKYQLNGIAEACGLVAGVPIVSVHTTHRRIRDIACLGCLCVFTVVCLRLLLCVCIVWALAVCIFAFVGVWSTARAMCVAVRLHRRP